MDAVVIGSAVSVVLLLAALCGMGLSGRLPPHHVSTESRDAIRVATAIVGTLSALALGFLIGSGKLAFDNADDELKQSVARVVLLDRVLANYGPETGQARRALAELVEQRLQYWGVQGSDATEDRRFSGAGIEPVQRELRALSPQTDAQRLLQTRAIEVSGEIAEDHWLLVETDAEGLPWAFLVILVFWLGLLFFSFGLVGPNNATVLAIVCVCAVATASAVFLVIDLAQPYIGLIQVSEAPLRVALEHLGKN